MRRLSADEYWVIDLDGRRAVAHSGPTTGGYERVEVLDGSNLGIAPVPLADVLAAAG